MSLPLETAQSPFKCKNSLGQVLVDGNQLDVSNINCYLQLLAQTASKKEKLRRKKRRERREKKKGGSSKERRRSRKEREGKEKEVEPDTPAATPTQPGEIKTEFDRTQLGTGEHGMTVAPTLPSHGMINQNVDLSRRSPTAADPMFDRVAHSTPAPQANRGGSWSQFIIGHSPAQQHDMMLNPYASAAPMVAGSPYPQQQLLHRPVYHGLGQPAFATASSMGIQAFDPAAEIFQLMNEQQSCSNPSFTFSSSFSSGSFSPIAEESYGGFPTTTPFVDQQFAPSFAPTTTLLPQQHPSAFYSEFGAMLPTSISPTSSFGIDPVDDRDGTFASLDFLEAALAQDMRDA